MSSLTKSLSRSLWLPAALALLFGAGPAVATDAPATPPPAIATVPMPDLSIAALTQALSHYLSEDETRMLFDFLSESAVAALQGGEEVALPPELAFKLAVLEQRLKKESLFYLQLWLEKLHSDIDQALRNARSLPPPATYAPPPLPPYTSPAPAPVPDKAN